MQPTLRDTSESNWPPRPPDKIRHDWRCTRRGPVVETIRADPNGQPHIVNLCTECDHDDLGEQIRDQRTGRPT
jgi:hypothetical protein